MICSKCKYYAPLIGRSYDLSKCLKFQMFVKDARENKCKGLSFFPKTEKDKLYAISSNKK